MRYINLPSEGREHNFCRRAFVIIHILDSFIAALHARVSIHGSLFLELLPQGRAGTGTPEKAG